MNAVTDKELAFRRFGALAISNPRANSGNGRHPTHGPPPRRLQIGPRSERQPFAETLNLKRPTSILLAYSPALPEDLLTHNTLELIPSHTVSRCQRKGCQHAFSYG